MAHYTKSAGFPQQPLNGGMQIRLRALSPTTDAEVAGVTCAQWSIYGRDKSEGPPLAEELPTWVPEEQDTGPV